MPKRGRRPPTFPQDVRSEHWQRVVGKVTYPPQLPVSQQRDALLEAIRDHQVVVAAGETGSGKTTQLPKICLELGRGRAGMIGHTQPRRLAARTVADRLAEELDTPVGEGVGYAIRFTDRVSDQTVVKLMTDGILLTEIQHDRMLRRYDTIIVDEAHERSLNIDFILGYLKQLLPRRPDLKVIITSATIDPTRFAHHFGDAPVIEVSGRTYPVEVRYRPIVDPDDPATRDRDQTQAICDAVDELRGEGHGDILVFLSGEREITDTADALARQRYPDTEVLPLYARLSVAEQQRVFQQHRGRRIVLATNVAETSLTVPGIKYVIDPGTARISRYSNRTKVQRLPIEPISQASARQRAGRCGRTSDGICIRLYSEEDFAGRPRFTDPEIVRTNLAAVILQMAWLRLGDVNAFPFVDPPDRRQVKDGVQLLEELGAFDPKAKDKRKRLTKVGRKLARMPIDPRLGRMVLEAERNGCVREVLVIVAALSIQDPRERPLDRQQEADQAHARFTDKTSDFLAYLNLWQHIRERQRELSSSQFRKLCRTEFLHYLRVREWQDLHGQLRHLLRPLHITPNRVAADPDRIHQSVLAGLLSHIGMQDPEKRDFLGARGARFAIFPGSALFKKPPQWVMSAELVETSRLWARVNARIEPEWAEELAGHLVRRSYSEPHWEKKRGAAMAYEKVTLYGVPIVAERKVTYHRVDPELSRELFIRHALVEGDWETRHRFFHENRERLAKVEELEHRTRRRDILVDEDTLFEFYDERIPAHVVSAAHFDAWWKQARRDDPTLLDYDTSQLIREEAPDVEQADYPQVWRQDGIELQLTYVFEPGAEDDGVTVHIPLPVLNQVAPTGFDWQVPGLREELAVALIRSLPKAVRRNFVPAPDHARKALANVTPGTQPLTTALGAELERMTGASVPGDAWDLHRVPDHLRMTFRVEDEHGATVATGKDLDQLKRRLHDETLRAIATDTVSPDADVPSLERAGLRSWEVGTVPRTVEHSRGGLHVTAYPALVDEGDAAAVRLLDTLQRQREAHRRGVRRLLLLGVQPPVKQAERALSYDERMSIAGYQHGSTADLLRDCLTCAVDALMGDGDVWDEQAFAELLASTRADLYDTMLEVVRNVAAILASAQVVDRAVRGNTSMALLPALADVKSQLAALVYPGFVTETGRARLPDVHRYLRAALRRLEKLPEAPQRDEQLMARLTGLREAYDAAVARVPAGDPVPEGLREVRWMLEELRVSLFAQMLGTAYPVSEKRIYRALEPFAP